MKYDIKKLYTDEKQTQPLTDQFGNEILVAIADDNTLVGHISIPKGVVGAEEFATGKLKAIIAEHQKNAEASLSLDINTSIADAFKAEMEAAKTNNGVGTK